MHRCRAYSYPFRLPFWWDDFRFWGQDPRPSPNLEISRALSSQSKFCSDERWSKIRKFFARSQYCIFRRGPMRKVCETSIDRNWSKARRIHLLGKLFQENFKEVQICHNIFIPSPQIPRKFIEFQKFCDPHSCSTHDVYKTWGWFNGLVNRSIFQNKSWVTNYTTDVGSSTTNGCTTSAREYLCDQDISSADMF